MYFNFTCSGSEKLSLKSDQLEVSGSVVYINREYIDNQSELMVANFLAQSSRPKNIPLMIENNKDVK